MSDYRSIWEEIGKSKVTQAQNFREEALQERMGGLPNKVDLPKNVVHVHANVEIKPLSSPETSPQEAAFLWSYAKNLVHKLTEQEIENLLTIGGVDLTGKTYGEKAELLTARLVARGRGSKHPNGLQELIAEAHKIAEAWDLRANPHHLPTLNEHNRAVSIMAALAQELDLNAP